MRRLEHVVAVWVSRHLRLCCTPSRAGQDRAVLLLYTVEHVAVVTVFIAASRPCCFCLVQHATCKGLEP